MARLIDANTLREVVISFQYTPTSNENERCVRAIDTAPTVEMPGWVSVEDRLPEREGAYLCWAFFRNEEWHWQINVWKDGRWVWVSDVRYWMPLPEPPEEVKKDEDD